ncbi:MAG: EamA family transporter, partial [Litorimonas sp.]
SVQIAMIGWGIVSGERLGPVQFAGLVIALAGLSWLLLPGQSRPDLLSAAFMAGSGLCWGVYSLLGRGGGDPTRVTAGNFVRASAMGVPVLGFAILAGADMSATPSGAGLAILSGAVTSGFGYAVWYTALKGLTATRAGVLQLAVPPLAALGGVVFLAEPLSWAFASASAITLAGIALASFTRPRYANSK